MRLFRKAAPGTVSREDVIWCYRTLLNREPESEAAIRSHSNTRSLRDLVEGFVRSPEFVGSTTNAHDTAPADLRSTDFSVPATEQVKAAFRGLLSRDPDVESLRSHSNALSTHGDFSAILADLVSSDEFRQRYLSTLSAKRLQAQIDKGATVTMATGRKNALDPSQDVDELKERNAALNSVEMKDGKLYLTSLLVSLYVDITLKCNAKCPSCFRSDPDNSDRDWPEMDFHVFESVAHALFPTAYRAILSGGGESIIHKDFDRMIELCLRYKTRPVLYTNGSTLNPKRIALLARAGTFLGISIDGASQETFEKLRFPLR
jgi:hypothetical protein